MKTFAFYVSTNEEWEVAQAIYLINAESEEIARKSIKFLDEREKSIQYVIELDMSMPQIKLCDTVVE